MEKRPDRKPSRMTHGPIANQLHALELNIKGMYPKDLAEQKKAWDALLNEHQSAEERKIRVAKERSTDPNLNPETEAGREAIDKAVDVEFNRRQRGPGSYEGELMLVIDEMETKIKEQNMLQDKVNELTETKSEAENTIRNLLTEKGGNKNTVLEKKLTELEKLISNTESNLNQAIFALNAFNNKI